MSAHLMDLGQPHEPEWPNEREYYVLLKETTAEVDEAVKCPAFHEEQIQEACVDVPGMYLGYAAEVMTEVLNGNYAQAKDMAERAKDLVIQERLKELMQ